MNLNLTTKTAVVTGAGRGIGLATVRTLIDEGARVVGAARTITPELKETGAYAVSADLSTRKESPPSSTPLSPSWVASTCW